jgi:hypothetical protein
MKDLSKLQAGATTLKVSVGPLDSAFMKAQQRRVKNE